MRDVRRVLGLAAVVITIVSPVVLAGCSAETKLSAKEADSVKGNGQMPPEARARLAEKMQESQQRRQQTPQQGAPKAQTP